MANSIPIRIDDSAKARFWAKVDMRGSNDCWDWSASLNTSGYGRFKLASYRQVTAHRLALVIASGEDHPALCALHSCDRPSCCNPAHLRWGTANDNAQDKIERGRNRTGNQAGFNNPMARLTAEDLEQIVALMPRHNNTVIAKRFGVTHSMISRIRLGLSWRKETEAMGWHIKEPQS